MARMKAIVITHWKRDGAGVYYAAPNDDTQAGESVMMRGSTYMKGTPTTQHVCLAEMWADEARIVLLDGTVHHVIATWYEDAEQGATGRALDDPLSSAEVSALSSWLITKTGKTNTQIANWFDSTPAQLSTELQKYPRQLAFRKLYGAWKEWIA